MDKNRQQKIYELLKRGHKMVENKEELPADWAREFFPPERREYELVYNGKDSEEKIIADTMAVPFQPVSTFGQNGVDWHNQLIFGDNIQALKRLLQMKEAGELINADGTPGVRLIYIDPPFATRKDFHGSQDQKAYQDKIAGGEFLEFLRKRLVIMRELLSDDGNICVHLDWKKGHYVKVLMDEVFGETNFKNEIIWSYQRWTAGSDAFQKTHDTLFWYAKHRNKVLFTKQMEPYSEKSAHQAKRQTIVEEGKLIQNYTEDTVREKSMRDVWDVSIINSQAKERIDYPTQKPEALLERVIKSLSSDGDIVLDCFAGSGTTVAVAEKLNRRWVAIDIGKFAVYTIQKRMLNLCEGIGNTGEKLQIKPFTLYNAGLYDFETLKELPWENWRFFALRLFECKDEPHKIRGFEMDGKRQGSSVLVFNHFDKGTVNKETIADIHASVGKSVGDKCFIIAPRGVFIFQEDFVEMDNVRYYALRIPYSYINEIHRRKFSALRQPNDETAVNETVEAVGFDFIQPPEVELDIKPKKDSVMIKIKKFESRARIKGTEKITKYEALSMVMVDFDYKNEVFDLDKVFYAGAIKENKWKIELPTKEIRGDVMLVLLDIYGNESRRVFKKKELISSKLNSKK